MDPRVRRIRSTDHVELLTDVGPVPKHIAALLMVDHPDAVELSATLARRLARIDRLHDRLVVPESRLRRPQWEPDARFDAGSHLTTVALGAVPTPQALVDAALHAAIAPLPRDRPPWRVAVLADPTGRVHGVAVVMHHVLADGLGALAVLQHLIDPAGPSATSASTPPARPARAPRPGVPGRRRRGRTPRTSLNAPIGARRQVHVVRADVENLRLSARAAGGTINDALLVAATAALERTLSHRGEAPPRLVASVLVSTRVAAEHAELGNRIAVMAVPVTLSGPLRARLRSVAATTIELKRRPRLSTSLLGPLLRLLAVTGTLTWVIARQRSITTFVTNLRGPKAPVWLAGTAVTRIVPISSLAGNVAVAFAALSYAGTLEVSVITDPDVVPEGATIAHDLGRALGDLSR